MPSSLPVVLLTGASRGLGLATATLLLRGTSRLPRAHVVALSRSKPDELAALEKEFSGSDADAPSLLVVQGDVTDAKANQKAVDAAVEKWGRLDALVLNAGVVKFARLADADPASFAEQLNINLVSIVTTLHAAAPHLRASPSGTGKVVLVSSGAAVGQYAGWGPYCAGKAGMNALARVLAVEEPKLAVWAVRPGVVATDMQADIRANGAASMGEQHSKFVKLHADNQLLPPEDPGHVLAALAVRGTRDEPKDKEGKGAGGIGAFLDWSELADYRRP